MMRSASSCSTGSPLRTCTRVKRSSASCSQYQSDDSPGTTARDLMTLVLTFLPLAMGPLVSPAPMYYAVSEKV